MFTTPVCAEVLDGTSRSVTVSERGAVSGEPCRFRFGAGQGALPWQPVTAWSGPWPVDESWWAGGAGLTSRFQLVGVDGRAWLMVCGDDGWRAEAGYD
ncbi:MAG: hypothetical protein LH468_10840 [Nocardioides sp.]|nr:hypothetical protein [Nocardioides sp.]